MKKEDVWEVSLRIDSIIRKIIYIETHGTKNSLVYISQNISKESIAFAFENHFYGRSPITETYVIPLDIIVADNWLVLLKEYLNNLEKERIAYLNQVDAEDYELYKKLKIKFEKS